MKTCKQFIFEALNGLKYRSTEKYKNRNSVARNCQQYSQGFSQYDWHTSVPAFEDLLFQK